MPLPNYLRSVMLTSISWVIHINRYGFLCRGSGDNCHATHCIPTLDHIWIVGGTGIGKSKYCWDNFPDAYRKNPNKWWCHYTRQKVVVVEDVEPSQEKWMGYFLKVWSDHYPFIGERKGGSRQIRPEKIIVTSNYTTQEVFSDPKIVGPLCRRFSVKTIENGNLVNYVVPSVDMAPFTNMRGRYYAPGYAL